MKTIILLCFILVFSCSGATMETQRADVEDHIPEVQSQRAEWNDQKRNIQKTASMKPSPSQEFQVPRFRPVTEDFSPLKKRIVSVSVRRAALRDVVKVIADTVHLNLVLEKGVNPEVPVTISLNNVNAEDALDTIFLSVDYFYEIRKNLLIVKAQDTVIYDFGHPSVVNSYSINLGGDILGGVSSDVTATGSTNLRGDINLEGSTDEKSKNLWDQIEDSLKSILETERSQNTPKPSMSINRITGTIVVTGSKGTLEKVENFLDRVRESLNRQVMIEARIVEVQLNESLKYGIDWQFLDDWSGVGSVTVGAQGFSNIISVTEAAFSAELVGANFNSLIKALQTQGNVSVLSNPRVSLMNGQTAILSVGRNVDFISRVQTTQTTPSAGVGTITFTVDTSSVLSGIMIGIVPYINPQGVVSMTVTPIITELIDLEDKSIGTSDENAITISLPTVDLREMSTTVKVRDSDMVIIGGLITKKETEEDKGIPFLSKIPLLGYLFKSKEITEDRKELVIMLKPTVVRPE